MTATSDSATQAYFTLATLTEQIGQSSETRYTPTNAVALSRRTALVIFLHFILFSTLRGVGCTSTMPMRNVATRRSLLGSPPGWASTLR